jgi:manganese/zinc/iron transport system substrate-binding protein
MRNWGRLTVFVGVVAVVAGCSKPAPSSGGQVTGEQAGGAEATAARSYPYTIVSTTGMVGDIVSQVAGDKADCATLIAAGVDPHLYKATVSDIKALQGADIIFYSGLMLEGKMSDALIRIASRKPVIAVTEKVDEQYLLEPPEFEGHFDPHLWMDVRGWMNAVEAVAAALADFDPANAATYAENAARYRTELEALDVYARKVLSSIPEESRVLITAHDAFNYLGRAYKVEVLGIQGLSTESEAGMKDIEDLVDLIVRRKVKAVFPETSVPSDNIAALQEGAKARDWEIRIGAALFSDAMGRSGTYEGTYIGMIDHNVTTIARGLGGSAPVAGMQGKLTGQVH